MNRTWSNSVVEQHEFPNMVSPSGLVGRQRTPIFGEEYLEGKKSLHRPDSFVALVFAYVIHSAWDEWLFAISFAWKTYSSFYTQMSYNLLYETFSNLVPIVGSHSSSLTPHSITAMHCYHNVFSLLCSLPRLQMGSSGTNFMLFVSLVLNTVPGV